MSERPLILIIDDNPENLRLAVDLLDAYSFTVRTARDGLRGLRRARANRPEMILLDVQMPGIDGYETCRRLKADPELCDIPVIFMTALTDVRDKLKAFEVGGVDYVTKPFEPPELLARLRRRGLQEEWVEPSDEEHPFQRASAQGRAMPCEPSGRRIKRLG